jgi:predicted transcriptional regulator
LAGIRGRERIAKAPTSLEVADGLGLSISSARTLLNRMETNGLIYHVKVTGPSGHDPRTTVYKWLPGRKK